MKAVKLGLALLPFWGAIAFPVHAQTQVVKFQCERGEPFEARINSGEAVVKFSSGKVIELLPVDTREGRNFSNGRTILRLKGSQASVETNYTLVNGQCVAQETAPTTVTSSN